MKNANQGDLTFLNKETINLYTLTESIKTWQAEEILYSDIRIREEELNSKLVEFGIQYMVNQLFYDALFDLIYTMGKEVTSTDWDSIKED